MKCHLYSYTYERGGVSFDHVVFVLKLCTDSDELDPVFIWDTFVHSCVTYSFSPYTKPPKIIILSFLLE